MNAQCYYDVKKEFEDVFRYNAMFMVNVEEQVSNVKMENVCIRRGAKVVTIAKIPKQYVIKYHGTHNLHHFLYGIRYYNVYSEKF